MSDLNHIFIGVQGGSTISACSGFPPAHVALMDPYAFAGMLLFFAITTVIVTQCGAASGAAAKRTYIFDAQSVPQSVLRASRSILDSLR